MYWAMLRRPGAVGATAGMCIRRAFCRGGGGCRGGNGLSAIPAGSEARSQEVLEPLDPTAVNFTGLKKETARVIIRAFKKAGKAEERLRKALEKESGPADDLASLESELAAVLSLAVPNLPLIQYLFYY